MEFNTISEVAGVMPGLQKFIVVEIVQGGEKRFLIRTAIFRRIEEKVRSLSHDDILDTLYEELPKEVKDARVKMLGGGWLDVSANDIKIKGSSHDYGVEPDRNFTVAALRRAFPDHEVSVECDQAE